MIGERLKRARVLAGLTLDGLAEKAGGIVTKQAISQYEKGQKTPSSKVLIALANALGVGIEYFFRRNEVEISRVDFRKHSKFGKKKQAMVKEKVREYLERYLEVENILGLDGGFLNPLEKFALKNLEDAEIAAEKVREEWKLGVDPIGNVVEMLEDNDVKVLYLEEEDKFNGLSGFANDDKRHPFVVLNQSRALSLDRKRFTALHELGHLLLPDNKDGLNMEKVADRFAGALLFPKESVIDEFGERRHSITLEELSHVKEKYGISIAAIVFRLKDCGVIGEALFKRFWIVNRVKKFDEQTPLKKEEKPKRFENLLARAYGEELISLSKFAELAKMDVDDAVEVLGEVIE